MLHDLLLAVLIVLVSLLYFKFAKLTKAIDGLYKEFEYSLDCIDKELKEIISNIANSTSKLQDHICGVRESIQNYQKDMIELTKSGLDEQVQQMKLVEKLNTSNTKDMLSAIAGDLTSTLTDITNKLAAHDNYVAANNKVTRPMLSELLEAIKSFIKTEQEKSLDTVTKEVEKPKTAIRRNKRKYTKDTEEVKE